MKNHGFVRTASAVIRTRTADIGFNSAVVGRMIEEAENRQVSILAFAELNLTGYTCADLFFQSILAEQAESHVKVLADRSRGKSVTFVIGAPVKADGLMFDCAIVIRNGRILGLVPKTHLTAAEERWFVSAKDVPADGRVIRYAGQECLLSPFQLFETGNVTFAVEIGSDLLAPVPPSSYHALNGAGLIINLSADPETAYRSQERLLLAGSHSARTLCGYIYSNAYGESTQDSVFSGASSIWENGHLLAESERYPSEDSLLIADMDIELIAAMRSRSGLFRHRIIDSGHQSAYRYTTVKAGDAVETDFEEFFARHVDPHPFSRGEDLDSICKDIFDIQTEALCTRLEKTGAKAVIGISGGLDSTLALLVTVKAFDRMAVKDSSRWNRKNIIAVTMPGFGTTSRTRNNAMDMMEALGVTSRNISIVPACIQHFKDIEHDGLTHDATYENAQARERTQILMDIANQTGGIVVGTGDLSELALGWATYNGDQMSMYGVNAGVPKTLVKSIVKWAACNRFTAINEILLDIVDTPISPELLPGSAEDGILQVTEDLVGPYELHDFFIYHFMKNGFSPEKILFLAKKAFSPQEYDEGTIRKWLKTFIRRFFSQQFKRSCMPDGPQVCEISLSPRGGWSMPSDIWSSLFTETL